MPRTSSDHSSRREIRTGVSSLFCFICGMVLMSVVNNRDVHESVAVHVNVPAPAFVPSTKAVETRDAQEIPKMSISTAKPKASLSPVAKLHILVLCGGDEHHNGGIRIWCSNYFQALRALGHAVTFAPSSKIPNVDVFDVAVVHGGDLKQKSKLISSLKTDNKRLVVCIVKVNNVDIRKLNEGDLLITGSWFHSYALLHSFPDIFPKLLPMKHIELEFSGSKASFAPPSKVHSVFPGNFSQKRPAIICYHGNDDHLNEVKEVFGLALPRVNQKIPLEFRTINRGQWTRGRPAGVKITEKQWTSMKDTFSFLHDCDVGLVPQLSHAPVSESPNKDYKSDHGVNLMSFTWKDSANAGRAFVFAQMGVPFITGPDLETMEMLGTASLESERFSAIIQLEWESHLVRLLTDTAQRRETNQKLLQYSKAHLNIRHEARKLEAALSSRVVARRKVII